MLRAKSPCFEPGLSPCSDHTMAFASTAAWTVPLLSGNPLASKVAVNLDGRPLLRRSPCFNGTASKGVEGRGVERASKAEPRRGKGKGRRRSKGAQALRANGVTILGGRLIQKQVQ
jgi:molybdopterin biosynthesis enzyme